MKEPHTVLFLDPTGVGKTHLALDLLEGEYFNHFNFTVIICPTLRYNKTYHRRKWFWTDPHIIPIELGSCLYDWMEKLGILLPGSKTLFLIDDIIANETLKKQRQPLLQLAILRRHKGHSVWLLMQSYTAIPLNIRRQGKMVFFIFVYIWYPKKGRRLEHHPQRERRCQNARRISEC